MTDTHYTTAIKNLFKDYYNRSLTVEEYRAQRKQLIDQMDKEFNGVKNRTRVTDKYRSGNSSGITG